MTGKESRPPSASAPSTIADRLAGVRDSIAEEARRAGRNEDDITLIAISKGKPAQAVEEALRAGQRVFGENRVQEALGKMAQVAGPAQWHLVGHLQSNKARQIPKGFGAIHSLDSAKLALALQGALERAGKELTVLIQLNWSAEASKSGVRNREELQRLIETVNDCPALRLEGLMTIPDPALDERETRSHFSQVRELLIRTREEFGLGSSFRHLSMGMSHDYPWAIGEGATMVRVGTAIFGARK